MCDDYSTNYICAVLAAFLTNFVVAHAQCLDATHSSFGAFSIQLHLFRTSDICAEHR